MILCFHCPGHSRPDRSGTSARPRRRAVRTVPRVPIRPLAPTSASHILIPWARRTAEELARCRSPSHAPVAPWPDTEDRRADRGATPCERPCRRRAPAAEVRDAPRYDAFVVGAAPACPLAQGRDDAHHARSRAARGTALLDVRQRPGRHGHGRQAGPRRPGDDRPDRVPRVAGRDPPARRDGVRRCGSAPQPVVPVPMVPSRQPRSTASSRPSRSTTCASPWVERCSPACSGGRTQCVTARAR